MATNSRRKGKTGELEFVKVLKEHGLEARRGQQFKGGDDSPDVICEGLPDIHFEVKRREAGNLYDWVKQAVTDAAPGKVPIVAHRRSNQEWVAIIPMHDMLRILILREINSGNKL